MIASISASRRSKDVSTESKLPSAVKPEKKNKRSALPSVLQRPNAARTKRD